MGVGEGCPRTQRRPLALGPRRLQLCQGSSARLCPPGLPTTGGQDRSRGLRRARQQTRGHLPRRPLRPLRHGWQWLRVDIDLVSAQHPNLRPALQRTRPPRSLRRQQSLSQARTQARAQGRLLVRAAVAVDAVLPPGRDDAHQQARRERALRFDHDDLDDVPSPRPRQAAGAAAADGADGGSIEARKLDKARHSW